MAGWPVQDGVLGGNRLFGDLVAAEPSPAQRRVTELVPALLGEGAA